MDVLITRVRTNVPGLRHPHKPVPVLWLYNQDERASVRGLRSTRQVRPKNPVAFSQDSYIHVVEA